MSQTGLSVQQPGTSFGLKLGGDLGSLGLPLNQAVPYLYFSQVNGASVSFGNTSASVGHTFALAVDVADPSIVAGYDDYKAGASWRGEIPYVPLQLPQGRSDPQIYGNLFFNGAVDLGDIPVKLSGNVVIDLDANNDGHLIGLTPGEIQRIAHDGAKVSDVLGSAVNDVKIGVNGQIDLSTEKYGVNLDATVGQGSAYYTPTGGSNGSPLVAFRGAAVNPFAGTVLEQFAPTNAFDLQGSFDGNRQWSFGAATGGSNAFGFGGSELAVYANNYFGPQVMVHMGMSGMLGMATVSLNGWVNGSVCQGAHI